MALVDEVEARVPEARLVQLTRQEATAETTVDADRLATACTDGQAEFELLTGATLDLTKAVHVVAAVKGVVVHLLEDGRPGDEAARERKTFEALCDRIRQTTGANARILPRSSSQLTPSDETPDGVEVRPDYDRATLAGTFLRPPRATSRDGRSAE